MGILLAIIIGGLAGWIASILLNRDGSQGIVLNVIVGIIGAFIANVLIAPLIGVAASVTELSLSSFLMTVTGSVILLAIVNLFTRGRVR